MGTQSYGCFQCFGLSLRFVFFRGCWHPLLPRDCQVTEYDSKTLRPTLIRKVHAGLGHVCEYYGNMLIYRSGPTLRPFPKYRKTWK